MLLVEPIIFTALLFFVSANCMNFLKEFIFCLTISKSVSVNKEQITCFKPNLDWRKWQKINDNSAIMIIVQYMIHIRKYQIVRTNLMSIRNFYSKRSWSAMIPIFTALTSGDTKIEKPGASVGWPGRCSFRPHIISVADSGM